MASLVVIVMTATTLGCSKEEMTQAYEAAKSTTQSMAESTVDAVKEQLPPTGSMTIAMDPALSPIEQATVEVIAIGDGRPNVVQFASYDPLAARRSYPALMLQGTTTSDTASSLVGQTIRCDMYFQASPSDPIAVTPPGQTIAVTIAHISTQDNTLRATLSTSSLVASNETRIQVSGGDITAVMKGESP